MSVPHVLLGLLEPAPRHGFGLKAEYDARFGWTRALGTGQVYATLARFERDGLAEMVGVESGEGPERRLYAVTPTGVEELDSWLARPEPPVVPAHGVLFAKVVLALMSGRPAGEILDGQRAVHLERMREVRRAVDQGDLLGRLAADYEIGHLDADLRWIELAERRLDALREGLATR
jgi:DNA-binding PadR family transcriptional regulator